VTRSSDPPAEWLLETPAGPARAVLHAVPTASARVAATLVLGHGAGGGIEAPDLLALARTLPDRGIAVVRVEQPWRLAGRRIAPAPARLDEAWLAIVPQLGELGEPGEPGLAAGPLLVGGRSAGARVACRTASVLGAVGVVALAFPLHPPGRPERSRLPELLGADVPTIVVQGERDPFGGPDELAAQPLPPGTRLRPVPGADHGFAVPARSVPGRAELLAEAAADVADWALAVAGATT
jgi:predicted alpha/beta-hydrolase family hydrolase